MNSHNSKVFSGIRSLPSGRASDIITPGCVVLEGGAFRGLYSEGVLDALMEADINMQGAIGVSAGALNGYNYISGQIGRAARLNLLYRHDKRYVGGMKAMLHNQGVIGFDFMFDNPELVEPFDDVRGNDPSRRFVVTATNCLNGKNHIFDRDTCSDIFRAIQASASMPYVSRMVKIDGVPYLDGGCSNKVPYQWPIKEGYKKIIVVRTRETAYRRKPISESSIQMAKKIYGHYPKFCKKLIASNDFYNYECDEMERLHREGRIFMIAPSQPVTIGRLEGDMEKLGALYYLGYHDAKAQMAALKAYLERA